MKESNIQNIVRMKLSDMGILNFRNNVGIGWAGKVLKILTERRVTVYPGDVVVRNARPLHAGLHKGSGDVIAITPIVITPAMVGKTIGVFTSSEIKTKTGRVKEDQKHWIEVIQENGGIAGVARSEDDAEQMISDFINRIQT